MVLGAALVVAGAGAFAAWWSSTLMGLPDVGDPFDVAAFVEKPMPDEENAFVLYREAAGRIGEEPSGMTYDWATAGPMGKAWLERSREAMEVWRRGTERPGALYIPSQSLTIMTPLPVVQQLRHFVRLAMLEGSRLEAEGDFEGAWRWYRAMFRTSRHLGHHASAVERLVGATIHDIACKKLTRWARDPRVSRAMLRRALDAVIADYAMTGPFSDNLKVEYLVFLKTYDDPALTSKAMNDDNTSGRYNRSWLVREARAFSLARNFLQEPERSKRVTRQIYANLLAAADLPPGSRPAVACTLTGVSALAAAPNLDLYAVPPSGSTTASVLPPDKIRRWFESTLYARHLMPAFSHLVTVADRERVTQANLVIALANRLHEVERGKPAGKAEDLVGPYLEVLPEGYKPPDGPAASGTSP